MTQKVTFESFLGPQGVTLPEVGKVTLKSLLGHFNDLGVSGADPGVLWKKAPRAMRAMRGKALETVPFQPYFGCTQSFLKVLSN